MRAHALALSAALLAVGCGGSFAWPDVLADDAGASALLLCPDDAGAYSAPQGSCENEACPAGFLCEPTISPLENACRPPPADAGPACFVPSCGTIRCACTCEHGNCHC